MSGAGFFNNMVRNRNHLYNYMRQRRAANIADITDDSEEIDQLRSEVAELRLVVASMLNLMLHKNVLTEDEMVQWAEKIDGMDGDGDGQFHGKVQPDGRVLPQEKPKPEPDAPSDLNQLIDAFDE